jgi:hypothetical protein
MTDPSNVRVVPTVNTLEAAALINALEVEQGKASRPVTRECLAVMVEIVYQHAPNTGGYQPPACKCGNLLPCPDYTRVKTLVESWGLL